VAAPGVTIRPFQPADQGAVRRLVLTGLAERWGRMDETKNPDLRDLQQTYVAAGHAVLVAEAGERIIGTGTLVFETPSRGRIVRMSVDSGLRRIGLGRRLVAALLDVARERGLHEVVVGLREVVVETTHDWHSAVALYESCGFAEYNRDPDDVHLRLRL
jgi:ribosomal protein S18 acetylase RimI-like enzyme